MRDEKRRDFLKLSGATAAIVASQGNLFAKTTINSIENAKENYPNTTYTENMYRNEFDFSYGKKEEHGYAYHCVNCQGNCAWEVWSNNGVVTRENQSAKYPSINAQIPDFNPRGCNKGVQHSQIMYEKDRILYPMKRVGERGAGEWERISWDEAATEVAQNIWDVMVDEDKGPSKLMVHAGTGLLTEGRRAAPLRFSTQLGAVRIYPASYLGDMFSGAAIAYGEGNLGCTYDFMYTVNTAVFWGGNPSVSRIPDAHFVWEGKYNGAKVIVITPEFNASAKSADLWIPLKAGSDNILAMSIIYEILHKKMFKPAFMKHYTDLTFLVRKDNMKMLRRSDIEHAKDEHEHEKYEEQFYCWNEKENKPALMPGSEGSDVKTLRLSDFNIEPALEGEWEIEIEGEKVFVTTAFEIFKKSSEKFSPEMTQEDTGVHPDTVAQLARDIALPKVVEITTGFSLNKYFNGMMSIWNIASICGITGRMGPYGGLNTENEFQLSGMGQLGGFAGKYNPRFGSGFVGEFIFGDGMNTFDKYFKDEDVKRAQNGMSKDEYMQVVNALLEEGEDGKVKGVKPHWSPEVALIVADSKFRRNKGSDYREAFLRKMKYFAYVDTRMSETAIYADILLPAKSHYEVWDLRTSPGYHRFTNLAQPSANLKRVGEAMDEWSMFSLLAKKLEEIANKPENIEYAKVPDDKNYARDGFHDLSIFHKEYTNTDEESESEMEPYLGTDKQAVVAALENVEQYEPWTIEKMYKGGGFLQLNEKAAKTSPLYADRPFNSNEDHLYKFVPFETLSGRQTFYVDHELYIKMGAMTNTGMKGIRPDTASHPFVMMTPHARWSIHSNYKASRTLQRLQRGKPYIQVNRKVAAIKGIQDGEEIRVFNQLGEFFAMAKVSSSCPPDGLVMEHGWEPYMYRNKKGHNEVVPTGLNLLEMADGWGHLKFGGLWDGNQYAYDGAVNFEKAIV
ncbi:molybdopterin-dependent oxidoreductase [Sulfurospirillum arcachonense]|uniref:molybdopterin-dependent oxidoreductase n=1 Tax=Sulfurospirillum arcachonense TaxID=57666 RepID=UPI00046A3DFB|nr:molybdopterin-dependent oxidoreductase [Sulfurospirillum arcachonense]